MAKKTKIRGFFLAALALIVCYPLQSVNALDYADSPATVVIGQTDFSTETECRNVQNQGSRERGLYWTNNVITAGSKMIVSEQGNNRVLIYNSVPTSNNQKPDVVIGQPDLCSSFPNQGDPLAAAANTLSSPREIYSDGTKLIIADGNNSRVLIYNSIPASNNESADVVVGQADMTSKSSNQGGSVAANTLDRPWGVTVVGGKLFVADWYNHRVLIYNSIPSSNNAAADVVIGQADFTHNTANQGSRNANTLNYPMSTASDGTKLLISDSTNHRVLIFDTIPAVNNASADYVIGQTLMTAGTSGTAANKLKNPYSIHYSNGKLLISDYNNNRVLAYNSIPAANGVSADLVIGQADFTSGSANRGGSAADNTLYQPRGVFYDGTKVYITDYSNNRLLIYNSYPAGDGASADVVVGQPDMTSKEDNQANTAAANTLRFPMDMSYSNSRLFLADTYNHRILIYNAVPTSNNASADTVVGQSSMAGLSANQGSTANADTLSQPRTVISDGTKLLVSDYTNNRILVFNSIPSSNGASADVVIGQTGMTNTTANQGSRNANTLYGPHGMCMAGSKLIVSDYINHRVLIYNSIPISNNTSADVVIGQANFTSGTANQGGSVGANTLYYPTGLWCDSSHLAITDYLNNRVLIYNSIPTSNNASADVVVGQADFTSNSENQGNSGPSANTLQGPYDVYSDGTRMFILDGENSRVLVYNSIPTSNNASADAVIGQPNMADYSSNQGGPAYANVMTPNGITGNGSDKIFIADRHNHRVLIFPLGPQNQTFSGPASSDTRSVNLTLGSDDAKEMMVSEDNSFAGMSWETFSASKSFTLSKGGGTKTVYAKMRDYANYAGSVLSQSIELDGVVPTVTSNQPATVAAGTTQTNLSVSTDKNTICKYGTENNQGYDDKPFTFSSTGGTSHLTTVSNLSDGNSYTYHVTCQDAAGNEESYAVAFSVSPTEYVPTIIFGKRGRILNLSSTEKAVVKNKNIVFKGKLANNSLKRGKVELFKDGKLVKKSWIKKNGRWSIPVKDRPRQKNSTHTYQFKYYDSHNNLVETSNTYSVLIDRQKPKFTSPRKTVYIHRGGAVTWDAVDNDQVKFYAYTFRGNKQDTTNNFFTIPETTPEGVSHLSIKAFDRAGNMEQRKIIVIVR